MSGPTRRVVIGSVAVALTACTTDQPSRPTAAPGGPSASSTPAHDPTWVAEENQRPGSTGWRIPVAEQAGDDLVGYANHASVLPGEPVELHLSSGRGDVAVEVFRVGHYGGKGGRLVSSTGPVAASQQPVPEPDALGTVRCDWPVSCRLPTDDWPEGTYLIRIEAGGQASWVPVTVRSRTTRGRLVVLNATTTYQAYNEWGGASLYYGIDDTGARTFAGRARAVSFDRPYDGHGASVLMKYEHAPIQLAEELGLDLAYLTSGDLDADPGLLDGAAGVLSLGHDEYWSVPMRRGVESARDAGTNLAFLGANACYWRVRLEDEGRTVVCYKSLEEDPTTGEEATALWRQGPGSRPENSFVGMLYEAFPAVGPFVVHDPDVWLLEGTGAVKGASYPGLVGSEIDRAYPIAGTPATLQVVGHSPTPLAGGRTTYGDMTYYTVDSGAGVVATGTMSWAYGIRGAYPRLGITEEAAVFARTVTTTLLTAMAAGPLGETHPAQPNLDSIGAPVTTSTGTGGPVVAG